MREGNLMYNQQLNNYILKMNQPIDFSPNGNINLDLLKSEIDRRISLIFGILNYKPQLNSHVSLSSQQIKHPNCFMGDDSQQQRNYCLDDTPVKDTLAGLSFEKNESCDQENKEKVQIWQKNCFVNGSSSSEDFANQFSFSLNTDGKHNTNSKKSARSNNQKNKENKELEVSILDKSKGKISTRKTPLRNANHSKTPSTRMQALNQSVEERMVISGQSLSKVREEVKNYCRRGRKEPLDNNVRANLLRRIEGMSVREKQAQMKLI